MYYLFINTIAFDAHSDDMQKAYQIVLYRVLRQLFESHLSAVIFLVYG